MKSPARDVSARGGLRLRGPARSLPPAGSQRGAFQRGCPLAGFREVPAGSARPPAWGDGAAGRGGRTLRVWRSLGCSGQTGRSAQRAGSVRNDGFRVPAGDYLTVRTLSQGRPQGSAVEPTLRSEGRRRTSVPRSSGLRSRRP